MRSSSLTEGLCHLHNRDPLALGQTFIQASLCIGGVPRRPVDDNVEEKTRYSTALLDSCLYNKTVRCPSIFKNAAGTFTTKLLYDVDEVVRNAIMPKNV